MGHIWKCIKSNNIQFESFYVSCCIVCKSQKFLYRQCSQRQRYTARGMVGGMHVWPELLVAWVLQNTNTKTVPRFPPPPLNIFLLTNGPPSEILSGPRRVFVTRLLTGDMRALCLQMQIHLKCCQEGDCDTHAWNTAQLRSFCPNQSDCKSM